MLNNTKDTDTAARNAEISAALPSLYKYAYKLLGRRYASVAEELVHDAVAQGINSGAHDPTKADWKGYLSWLVRGRVFNFKQKACNRWEHTPACTTGNDDPYMGANDLSDDIVLAGPDTATTEAKAEIAALAALEGQERLLIDALALGHTLSEAAEIAGWSVATACRKRKEIAARIGR